MRRRLCCLLPALLGLQLAHAEPARTPHQLIARLGVETRAALEAPKPGKADAAERAVAEQITALVRSSPGDDTLFAADAQGRAPLMLAVSGAYPRVVDALLADPIVKARINARDNAGETAWMVANFAPALTLAACQPGALTLERYPLLLPYLRRMSALLGAEKPPAAAIVSALERAGARADAPAARQAWLARCPNTEPELRARLDKGTLLTTLVDHAVSRQAAFSKAYREGQAGIAQKPPPQMRFVAAGPREPAVACARKPALALPGALAWSGELLFRADVATRAGVVEVADLTLLSSGEPDPRVVDYFRSVILRALAAYRCGGEHVFEQEFRFRIE
jgi:hypothetical protein